MTRRSVLLVAAILGLVAAANAADISLGKTKVYLEDGTDVVTPAANAVLNADADMVTLDIEGLTMKKDAPDSPYIGNTCVIKPLKDIFDYEAVEVFLANAADEYLEVGVTSEGWYYAALYKKPEEEPAQSKEAKPDNLLVELLEVSIDTSKDCVVITEENCWRVVVTFPADYLPRTKVTKYNVYYTGEQELTQAAGTTDDGVETFHDLATFVSFTDDVVPKGTNDFWDEAKGDMDFTTSFSANELSCEDAPEPELLADPKEYEVDVTYTKISTDMDILVSIDVTKGSDESPDMDSEISTVTDDIVWFSFTNSESSNQLRVGVTSTGQTTVQLFHEGNDISLRNYELTSVFCDSTNTMKSWTCEVTIPWHYLPPGGMNWHQVIHTVPEPKNVTAVRYSCPGKEVLDADENPTINFVGCPVDFNLFTNKESTETVGDYWEKALDRVPTPPDTTTESGAIYTSTMSLGLVVISVILAALA